MASVPTFNPNQAYEAVPVFDPSQPHEVVPAAPQSPQNLARKIQSSPLASNISSMALGMADPILGLNSLLDKAVGGAGQFIASAGGAAPNPVSDWFGNLTTAGDKVRAMFERDNAGFRNASGQSGFDIPRLAGNIASPVNAAMPPINSAVDALGTGAAYGAMQPTQEGASPLQNAENAAVGALGSGALYGITRGIPALARNLFPIGDQNPEVANLANRAQQLGVPIRPGQMSGSPTVKVFDDQLSRMPGTGYTPNDPMRISPNAQHEAFTRAVSQTFGEDAPELTQQIMAQANARITGQMNAVLGRNTVTATPALAQELIAARDAAVDALDDESVRPVVHAVDRIAQKMAQGGGQLTGQQYLSWRQRGGLLSALTENGNPTIAHYGQQIRNILDDAFEQQAGTNDAALLQEARAQFRNLRTVEPLAAKAPTGRISPALLLGAVRSEFPDMARNGAGDLGDLGRIGQAFLKEPPNSTTAERGFLMQILRDPLGALKTAAGVPLSATIGRGLNATINSPTYAARLTGAPLPPQAPMGQLPTIAGRLPPAILAQLLLASQTPRVGQ